MTKGNREARHKGAEGKEVKKERRGRRRSRRERSGREVGRKKKKGKERNREGETKRGLLSSAFPPFLEA